MLLTSPVCSGRVSLIFPMVNPIGMGQVGLHHHQGRYDLPSRSISTVAGSICLPCWRAMTGLHKWRPHCRLTMPRITRLSSDRLSSAALETHQPVTALDHQRLHVAREAFDSDIILDLHCDDAALSHIFIVPQLMPEAQDLSTG